VILLGAMRLVSVGSQALETIGRARTHKFDDVRRARFLRDTCARICDRHGFGLEVDGRLPRGPAVFVANHVSYIDPLVIGSLFPCVPLAKAEIASWPVVGNGAQALGVIFVRRGDVWSGARAIRSGLRALEEGVSVLGFPEGTTSRNRVLPFQRGLFGLARLAGVPIVPIALSYDDPAAAWVGDEWFLPHYVRTAMRPRTRAFLRVGDPIAVTSADGAAESARARIAALLGRSS
jgi:1-acyl-sn-glycerol-3-phosphate acyltransferase